MLDILLTFIFIRPFVSTLAFPYLNLLYSAALMVFIIFWISRRGIPTDKIPAIKYPVLLFACALLVSTAFSSDRLNSVSELYKYVTAISLFLIVASLAAEAKAFLVRIICWSGLVASLLAIHQYFFGFKHVLTYMDRLRIMYPFAFEYIARKRVYVPFVTPNLLGGYLAMITPLIMMNKKSRAWFLVPVISALLLTKSLGATFSLFLGLTFYFYLRAKTGKKNIVLLGILLSTFIAIFIARSSTAVQHISPAFSAFMRFNYWKDTLGIIRDNFLTGVGPGNFNLAFARYAHNSYLQVWAEMGLLGIVSFLWLVAALFKSALKENRQPADKAQLACLATSSAIFLIHNLVDFAFFLPEISLIWWVILGLLLSHTDTR